MPYGYEDWVKLSRESYSIGSSYDVKARLGSFKPAKIAISGMGGSGIVGDIARDSLKGLVNVVVHKDFGIPEGLGRDTLFIAVSYSGETIETICSAVEAHKAGIPVVGVTTGGRMSEILGSLGVPVVKVPKSIAPRFGLPNLLYATLGVISQYIGNIPGLEESISVQEEALKNSKAVDELANWLKGYVPFILAPSRLQGLAYRFKNDLNENAKTPAVVAIVPEADHNDIVSLMLNHPVKYILIKGRTDEIHDYLMNSVEEVVRRYAQPYVVELKGESILAQEMYGAALLGLVSLRLAEYYGIDPVRTDPIAMLKDKLSSIKCW